MKMVRLRLSPMAAILALAAFALVALLVHEFFASNTERASPVLPLALVAPPPPPTPEVNKPEPEPPEPLTTPEASEWAPGAPGTESGPAVRWASMRQAVVAPMRSGLQAGRAVASCC
jgi:hypothetical protein